MPYSTIPITSGAAKFSTLDPDAPLFLQENNITRGADPENPITFYNQQTGELNAVNSIITSAEELNINSSDLIGVRRFICQDYLGAVQANASNNTQATLILDKVATIGTHSKKFRIPSNFVDTSTMNFKIYATNSDGSSHSIGFQKYDPDTQTYTSLFSISIPANTTTPTEFNNSSPVPIKAGELYAFVTSTATGITFYGSMGVKILCDISPVTSALWEVIN